MMKQKFSSKQTVFLVLAAILVILLFFFVLRSSPSQKKTNKISPSSPKTTETETAPSSTSVSPTPTPETKSETTPNTSQSQKTTTQPTKTTAQKLEEANAFMLKKEYEQAIPLYQEVIRENPRLVSAYNSLAIAYAEKGNKTEALKVIEEGLLKNPGDFSLLQTKDIIEYRF